LKVEPGGYAPAIARLRPGVFARLAASALSRGASFLESTFPTNNEGLYVGFEAIARTAPSRGSSATMAPPFAAQ